jgi:hypothetical protein
MRTARPSALIVRIVVSLAATLASTPVVPAQVPTWSARQIARIGSVDDADLSLTRVTGVLIDSRAHVYVLQPQDRQVAVFDSSGRRVRLIGRSGEGPGEFDAVSAAGLRADTLYVADNALGRISFFDADGAPIRTVRFASPAFGTPPAFYLPTVPQVLLADGAGLVRPEVPIALIATGTGSVPYLRISPAGEISDTLVLEDLPPQTFEIVSEGNRVFAARPFPDRPLFHWLADGSGLVVVDRPAATDAAQASFRVTKIRIDGDTVFSRSVDYTPARLDEDRVTGAISEIVDRLAARRNAPGRAPIEQALRNLDLIPAYRPPVASVASAADGSIWIERDVANVDTAWLVLNARGDPIGQLRLADGQRIMAIRDDLAAALELDPLDVPYVVLYRLRR